MIIKIPKKISGFSLIELMVAMMIGLFLVFVVVSSYSSNKSSNIQRSELSELESNARAAMAFLRDGIEHAGYPSAYIHTVEKPFLTASDGDIGGFVCDAEGVVSFQQASYINNNNRYTKDHASRDRISIAYMPDNPKDDDALYWQDCAASYAMDTATNSIQAERCSADPIAGQGHLATVYNSYFIDNDELKCTTSRNVTVPIASGIEAMQFRYGVRTAGNTVYRKASFVENNNKWSDVVSVHVAMLVRSAEEIKNQDESQKYLLLDREVTKNDRYLRKVYTSFIHLSNRDR